MTGSKTLRGKIMTWLVVVLVCLGLQQPIYGAPQNITNQTKEILGLYEGDAGHFLVRERDGELEMLYDAEHSEDDMFKQYAIFSLQKVADDEYRLVGDGALGGRDLVRFERDADGRGTLCQVGNWRLSRHFYGPDKGLPFRIQPLLPLQSLKEMATGQPPKEKGDFLQPDLVEVVTLDPTIKLDIRYATDNNFMGITLYDEPRAFLQRPAAEALVRVHQKLADYGYGLMIHDAYRPWYVTKMFWDATPDQQKVFVADPAKGSRHNRGGAVDVALYNRQTGQGVAMISGYDEFSPRAYSDYLGGTSLERQERDLLRLAMEEEGFTIYDEEWWHFDYRDWRKYSILNLPFNKIRDTYHENQQLTTRIGVSFSNLELNQDVKQIVLVESSKVSTQQGTLTMWKKVNDEWYLDFLPIKVVLGQAGLISADQKMEGDKATPNGIYPLRRTFGYAPFDNNKIQYIHLSRKDFWVDDPASPSYNQLVKGRPVSGTYESMRRNDDLYKFGIVIEYNTEPIVKGKGSAIFMHIWRNSETPTLGCVAMDEESIIKIIKWLDPEKQPVVILKHKGLAQ